MIVDESHVTIPQVRGMFNGDQARKQVLVDHGFRLPSAMDNRPLKFTEFEEHISQIIYVSATPGPYELEHAPEMQSNRSFVQQDCLIRLLMFDRLKDKLMI